jgi:hypothetical protein
MGQCNASDITGSQQVYKKPSNCSKITPQIVPQIVQRLPGMFKAIPEQGRSDKPPTRLADNDRYALQNSTETQGHMIVYWYTPLHHKPNIYLKTNIEDNNTPSHYAERGKFKPFNDRSNLQVRSLFVTPSILAMSQAQNPGATSPKALDWYDS